ncbi:MAG: zinc ribbon domain-containing protein [Candidatus Acidiferrales bacterium]
MTTITKESRPATHDSRARETQATIASVSDQDFYITRTYGVFHIPARPSSEACALLVVTPRGDVIDLGDNRRFPFTISPRDIAEDIFQDLEQHGIFVCAAERSTEDELTSAREGRDAWFRQLIAEADEMWARGHSYREISDMHRRASLAMKLDREWAYVPQRNVECPACGEQLRAGAAICKHCNAVLDAERAAKYFPNGPLDKFAHAHAPATASAHSSSAATPQSSAPQNASSAAAPALRKASAG